MNRGKNTNVLFWLR